MTHIHGKRNIVANCLAKRSIDREIGICRLPSAPEFANAILLDDITDLTGSRAISAAYDATMQVSFSFASFLGRCPHCTKKKKKKRR